MTPISFSSTARAGNAPAAAAVGPVSLHAICALERVVAAIALIVVSPALTLLAVVTLILSRRGPFIRHVRVGFEGRPLVMLKLRTMWDPAAVRGPFEFAEIVSGTVPEEKTGLDERVSSPWAEFCRRYSLDELPQLIHVARGEMSFVGPRPVTRDELDRYYGHNSREVLSVRPGLAGLWQVMGRNRLSYAQRRRLDLFLVRHVCASLYLHVLLRSIPVAISGDGAC